MPEARFSKVLIINGPAKLLLSDMQDRGFNSLASNIIKLSVSETKWSSLLARTRALILSISIWIFDLGLSRNGPHVWKRVWKMTFFGLKWGQDLESRVTQPHQEFPGVSPGADTFLKQNSTRIAGKLRLPLLTYYFDVINVNDSGYKLSSDHQTKIFCSLEISLYKVPEGVFLSQFIAVHCPFYLCFKQSLTTNGG